MLVTSAGTTIRHGYRGGTQSARDNRKEGRAVKFKKDDEGKLVLDDNGDPIAVSESGEVIPLDKVVSLGKHERVEGERDGFKAQVEKLTAEIAELQKATGDSEELKKKLEEITEAATKEKGELEARLLAQSRGYALDTALLGAGVPAARLKAAKALIDAEKLELDGEKLKGLDLESFKKDNAYLFDAPKSADMGAPPAGGPSKDAEHAVAMREAAGLPPKKE